MRRDRIASLGFIGWSVICGLFVGEVLPTSGAETVLPRISMAGLRGVWVGFEAPSTVVRCAFNDDGTGQIGIVDSTGALSTNRVTAVLFRDYEAVLQLPDARHAGEPLQARIAKTGFTYKLVLVRGAHRTVLPIIKEEVLAAKLKQAVLGMAGGGE